MSEETCCRGMREGRRVEKAGNSDEISLFDEVNTLGGSGNDNTFLLQFASPLYAPLFYSRK